MIDLNIILQYKSLLQQQVNLQSEIEKCILIENNNLLIVQQNSQIYVETDRIESFLGYILEDLQQIKENNGKIIWRLKRQIKTIL